jgi:hypothetical protein
MQQAKDGWDLATKIIHVFGDNPWLVYVTGALLLASFVRNLLKGAYPADRGIPPRWVSGLVLALGPASVIIKGIGRWLAGKLSWFGFSFLDEKTLTESVQIVADKATGTGVAQGEIKADK